jgi:hypothetical protein
MELESRLSRLEGRREGELALVCQREVEQILKQ